MVESPAEERSRPDDQPTPHQIVVPLPEVVSVSLTVNGRLHTLSLDPRTTLLDLLREHLDLTGTKKGFP